ncbi:Hyoscyamine 6-dioxygenase [Camellia lanceoleosa]|uniref:Hyoscyamine 6-dioxygenase n=1 Tax=Camellia lanceoleosa TaxID=1840588 RepID=A0ACC0J5Q2_9ERIC|nr:Hyoscyamine 6-dioxygenase [Camellia lanceoleosa]
MVFLSTRSDLKSVPDCYVLPPDKRPKQHDAPIGQAIPVIDIQNIVDPDDRAEIVQQILKACQEFGLGLEPGYFAGDHSKTQLLSVNHHIPCPDPSLTLGHAEHSDPNLIAALHQCDVPGLQTCKDGQWIGVQPIPHAFVIIPGVQFKVFLSTRSDVQSLPDCYVLPPDKRPKQHDAPVGQAIPVIDIQNIVDPDDRAEIVQQIVKACQEFGLFQVFLSTRSDVQSLPDCYVLPPDKRPKQHDAPVGQAIPVIDIQNIVDPDDRAEIVQQIVKACQEFVIGPYSVEVRKFLLTILDLLCDGLGLEPGYFAGDHSKTQLLSVNHHIPCPDPSLTLGHAEHSDPNLITALHQCDVPGLQIRKDGQWIGVQPIPHAFVIIPGIVVDHDPKRHRSGCKQFAPLFGFLGFWCSGCMPSCERLDST